MRPPKKDDALFLSKIEWTRVFFGMSLITLTIYVIAMVFSLCGSNYFILNYQNPQMDRVEAFLINYKVMPLLNWCFTTLEFFLITTFVTKRVARFYYVIPFYAIAMVISAALPSTPLFVYQIYQTIFYLICPLIEEAILSKKEDRRFSFKRYGIFLLRLLIAAAVVFVLQILITIIKSGDLSFRSVVMNLSATFIYSLEYDIALSVLLFTIALLLDKEKGDSLWATFQPAGSSSQTSMKQSLKSNTKKNLTKTQRRKIRWLYAKLYVTQLGAFLLILVLPFLLGKVFEFLVMYLSFAITRVILGLKYSLHFKKEALCISVGLIVFGILALAIPFFYIVVIIAVNLGVALAVLLHLSYKYQSMWLFSKAAKPDKFAVLYTFFDGDLGERHIKIICQYHGLDHFQTLLIYNYMAGEKISYLAFKFNYSQRMLIYKLDEAIDKLLA